MNNKDALNTKILVIAMFVVAAVSVLCYFRTVPAPYVYDDKAVLRDVQTFRMPGGWKEVFTHRYFDLFGERTWRPVVTLSFFVDAELWNLSPSGAHVISILLHILISWFVLAMLYKLLRNPYAAMFGAAIFAAHPIHVESVALASNREELLCALFYFAAFYLYMLWRPLRRNIVAFLLLAAVTFVMAMFSKEMAASLPAALLLYDILLPAEGRTRRECIRNGIPFYVITSAAIIAFIVIKFTFMRNDSGAAPPPADTLWLSFLTMCRAFLMYIELLVAPVRLCAQHIVPPPAKAFGFYMLFAASFFAFIAAAVSQIKKRPLVSFAMFFFILSLLPVSNIIPFGEVFAERYAYIPSFALSILAGGIFVSLIKSKPLVIALSLAAVAICIALSFIQSGVWKSDLSLWGDTVRCEPRSFTAHHNLGNFHAAEGDFKAALDEYAIAKSCPHQSDLHKLAYNRGLALLALGKKHDAKEAFVESIRHAPSFAMPHFNLGAIAESEGNDILAGFHYQRAIDKDPYNPLAYYIAGRHKLQNASTHRQLREAFLLLSHSVGLNPYDANARAALGLSEIRLGNRRGGLEELNKALQIDPDNKPAIRLLARYRISSVESSVVFHTPYNHANWVAWLIFCSIFFIAIIGVLYVRYLTME